MRILAALLALPAALPAACTLAVEQRDGARWEVWTAHEGGDLQRGPLRGLVKLVTGPHRIGDNEEEFALLPLDRLVLIEGKQRTRTVLEFDLGQTGGSWRRVRVVVPEAVKTYPAVLDLLRDSQYLTEVRPRPLPVQPPSEPR